MWLCCFCYMYVDLRVTDIIILSFDKDFKRVLEKYTNEQRHTGAFSQQIRRSETRRNLWKLLEKIFEAGIENLHSRLQMILIIIIKKLHIFQNVCIVFLLNYLPFNTVWSYLFPTFNSVKILLTSLLSPLHFLFTYFLIFDSFRDILFYYSLIWFKNNKFSCWASICLQFSLIICYPVYFSLFPLSLLLLSQFICLRNQKLVISGYLFTL